ncbi:MAG: efflux RND transporter periplasmic adaptor subunit [Candidatus Binatia bacterium]|nr:efflux RND transporter periplasmic adaptor subunit [Candidatus Binatia bacterium]
MRSRRVTASLFGVGAIALVAAVSGWDDAPRGDGAPPTARALRGDVTQSLVEPGTLRAARSVTLASEIRSNRAKIVSLLPDGTWVEPGDTVLRFDPTPFEEERLKALADVRDAEAATVRAEQERKLQIAKAEESLESTRHAVRLAELNLEAFEKGTGALNVREAEVRAAEMGAELSRAREDLMDMERMLRQGFVSAEEVSRQRGRVENLGRQDGLQGDRLRTAREIHYPRDLERSRNQLEEAEDAVARAEGVLYYTREYYRAVRESAQRKEESTRTALGRVDEQLAKTQITTPIAGFLVLQDIPLENGKRRPQVGDSVWSGVPIATVPDLSKMQLTAFVREVDLHRVSVGMAADVAIEAYPDLRLEGRIGHIGSLAENVVDSPWKFFPVTLTLATTDDRLRPGMSARVEFELARSEDVVRVPADAIFTRGDRRVVYIRHGSSVAEHEVSLGLANETHVEIRAGIDEGDELLLESPGGSVAFQPLPEPRA